jgi:hypothetical protein
MSDLVIKRAYLVVASLVGTLKVGAALRLPDGPRRAKRHYWVIAWARRHRPPSERVEKASFSHDIRQSLAMRRPGF